MAQAQRYKLTLSKLDFISLVDDPAQPNATTLLIKRKGKQDELQAVAKYLDADESLGLAWFWAFTSTEKSGEPHYDHHGDQVAADSDMVRAVLDYMKRGGAVDEMHDYEPTAGQVVFAMPITADVAKTIGIAQTGLLVTVKCTPEQITKLKDGTYNGVSIAGLGVREPIGKGVRKSAPKFAEGDRVIALANHMDGMKGMAGKVSTVREGDPPYYGVRFDDQEAMPGEHKWLAEDEIEAADGGDMEMKRRVAKHSLITDEVDGHQHQIFIGEDGTLWTSYATSATADTGHAHAVTQDATGAIVILADSGHTHQLAAGQPAVIVVPEGAVVVTEVAARRIPTTKSTPVSARASESPRSIASPTVKNIKATSSENNQMTTDANKIAELEKSIALISKLSTTEHALWKSLPADEAQAFLTKSVGDRAPLLAEFAKRDEVVYTADDGTVYRKSHDQHLVSMAKRLDESERARKDVEVTKRADALFGATKSVDGAHVKLVKAIENIADGTEREAVTKFVGQLVATSKLGRPAPGSDGGIETPEQTATEQLDAMTLEYAAKNNVDRPTARVAVMKTAEGKRLYRESVGRA